MPSSKSVKRTATRSVARKRVAKRSVAKRSVAKRSASRKTTRRLSSGRKKISLRANGWGPGLPMAQRHLVLVRMVQQGNDPHDIIRRLRHLAAYVRVTDPARYLVYRTDAEWAMRNLLLRRLMASASSSSSRPRRRRVVKRKSSSTGTRKRTTVRRRKTVKRRAPVRRRVARR